VSNILGGSTRQESQGLQLNLDEAKRFLQLLDPTAASFSFQTVGDGTRRSDKRLSQPHHGTLSRLAAQLIRLNTKFGAAIYVTINETDGKGRTKDNIVRIRAVWADLDRGLPQLWVLHPSIIVETSPGRYQVYWLLEDDLTAEDCLGVLLQLVQAYNGDPGVATIERVLRVPGFLHQKATPFRVRIVEASDRRYTAAEIMDAHPPIAQPAASPAQAAASEPADIDELRDALAFIDPDPRPTWRDVGMGLKHELGEAGRELWDTWSMQSGKYTEAEQEKAWRSFGRSTRKGKPVTAGTIVHLAKKGGWLGKRRSSSADEDFEGIMSNGISHDALALTFAARHGQDLRHVNVWGRWMLWAGTHWKEEQTRQEFNLARKIAREEAEKHKASVAKELRSAATRAAIVSMASDDPQLAAPPDVWDRDPWLLATPGGTVDLKTGVMREARRADYITKATAVAPGGECPLWLKTLDQIFAGDRELIAYVQRIFGYCLTGSTQEQVFFFCHGLGGNGKGTVLNTLKGIMADYGRMTEGGLLEESRHQRHSTAIAELRGKRAVFSQETKNGGRWDETLVKSLTGGDPITAHFMRQDNFEYAPEFKLIVAGNHKPQLRSVTEAMRRRLHLVPFNITFRDGGNRVHGMEDVLKVEWPGILRWAIDGCVQWQEVGLAPPATVRAATDVYFQEQDAMSGFLAENCMADDPNAVTETGVLFTRFGQWCDYRGKARKDAKAFSVELEAQGFRNSHDRVTRRSRFHGIRLIEQPWMFF
jgi:P4 family phage/plasmid primase-like protien